MEDGLVKINSIKQNMKTIMIGSEDGKLLRMKGTTIPRNSNFARETSTNISPIRLWHVRYGNLNFEILSQLQKQGMFKGLPTFKNKIQVAKISFMENKVERLCQQVHGTQTSVCNWFTVTFANLYRIL